MDAQRKLNQLRGYRVKKDRDIGIRSAITDFAESSERTHKKLGSLAELWQQVMPAEIVRGTAITGLRSGVLHVAAESSAISFEVDRRLREGAEAHMRAMYRGTLLKVRVKVGKIGE
ncbi:MAG TPA: DciA family protein [Phycisphaerales bacterium]|nr:DciA family protein [Phycisphaerales bacterium]